MVERDGVDDCFFVDVQVILEVKSRFSSVLIRIIFRIIYCGVGILIGELNIPRSPSWRNTFQKQTEQRSDFFKRWKKLREPKWLQTHFTKTRFFRDKLTLKFQCVNFLDCSFPMIAIKQCFRSHSRNSFGSFLHNFWNHNILKIYFNDINRLHIWVGARAIYC